MMLDSVELARKPLTRKVCGEQVRNALPGTPVPKAIEYEPEIRAVCHQISKLAVKIGPAVLVECNVLDVRKSDTGLSKTVGNRLGRKASPVFHATKSLFFRSRDQLAVADERYC